MDIKRCEKGHFYNGDKYATCPHCEEESTGKEIINRVPYDISGYGYSIDENIQETLAYRPNEEMQETVAYRPNEEMQETVAYRPNEEMQETVAYRPNREMQETAVYRSGVEMQQDFVYNYPQGNANNQTNDSEFLQSALPVGWLVVIAGPGYGKQYPLYSYENTIGQNQNNTIIISDPYLSEWNHCVLSFDVYSQKLVVNIYESTGNISINGNIVQQNVYLYHKDILQIGGSMYMFIELCREGFSWWYENNSDNSQQMYSNYEGENFYN